MTWFNHVFIFRTIAAIEGQWNGHRKVQAVLALGVEELDHSKAKKMLYMLWNCNSVDYNCSTTWNKNSSTYIWACRRTNMAGVYGTNKYHSNFHCDIHSEYQNCKGSFIWTLSKIWSKFTRLVHAKTDIWAWFFVNFYIFNFNRICNWRRNDGTVQDKQYSVCELYCSNSVWGCDPGLCEVHNSA